MLTSSSSDTNPNRTATPATTNAWLSSPANIPKGATCLSNSTAPTLPMNFSPWLNPSPPCFDIGPSPTRNHPIFLQDLPAGVFLTKFIFNVLLINNLHKLTDFITVFDRNPQKKQRFLSLLSCIILYIFPPFLYKMSVGCNIFLVTLLHEVKI